MDVALKERIFSFQHSGKNQDWDRRQMVVSGHPNQASLSGGKSPVILSKLSNEKVLREGMGTAREPVEKDVAPSKLKSKAGSFSGGSPRGKEVISLTGDARSAQGNLAKDRRGERGCSIMNSSNKRGDRRRGRVSGLRGRSESGLFQRREENVSEFF